MAVMTGKRTPTGRHLTVVPDVPATHSSTAGADDSGPVAPPSAAPTTSTDAVVHAVFGGDPNTRSDGPFEALTEDTESPAQSGSPFTPEMTASEIYQMVADAGAPPELLAMIEGFGDDVEALIAWLGEMGMGESPRDTLDGILAGWQPLLKRGAGALEAELSGAEFLRMFEVTLGDADSADPLSQLITDAASTGAREALAMARVLQRLGPL